MSEPRNIRIFEVHHPSEPDIVRAGSLPAEACPRRYCWWWRSLRFEWETPVAQGCTFESERDRGCVDPAWPQRQHPCRRKDSASPADHYEPREPHLLEDGFPLDRWTAPRP